MTTDVMVVDVSQDWVAACDLQERFMQTPCAKMETLSYSAQCRQVRALGGDCFDFLPLPGRRVSLAIADASGKGLAAALMIANVQSSLRTAASFAPDDAAAVVTAEALSSNETCRRSFGSLTRKTNVSTICLGSRLKEYCTVANGEFPLKS